MTLLIILILFINIFLFKNNPKNWAFLFTNSFSLDLPSFEHNKNVYMQFFMILFFVFLFTVDFFLIIRLNNLLN